MSTPLATNPLVTRDDFHSAVLDLTRPLAPHVSPGGARVRLGAFGAHYPDAAAELEGFARRLWGLSPLAAGRAHVDLTHVTRGLTAGTDPDHPEYWGPVTDGSQLIVEAAALAFALALAPEHLWSPLDPRARRHVKSWLERVNHVFVGPNNWQWFRVLVNVALERLGEPHDDAALTRALDLIDRCYEGGGWYADGLPDRERAQLDHYVPFAMHFYGLAYARLRGDHDPVRAATFRARAAAFA
ncbi:DUF2264 domain-containing protein, partial [Deinococcus pimensis]|uniref:DUF2264 domain-containing protein n=1 Tax=Deinococcus pimensis TaxID=309888 RepID=UPI00048822D7